MYCVHCGAFNDVGNTFCTSCGQRMVDVPITSVNDQLVSRKSALVAVILAIIIPGAGQIYAERVSRGLIVLVVTTITIFLLAGVISWVYGMVDSFLLVRRWNLELEGNPYVRPW